MKNTPEHNLQVQVINLLRNYYGLCVFAVPNGGSRNLYEARNLKNEGVMAGVSDLILVLNGVVVFLELKAGRNKQQESQKIFERKVKGLGHQYYVVRSLDDVVEILEKNKSLLTISRVSND